MSAPRVLIVRFSSIGDVVMALPVASVIRRSCPEAFIGWVLDEQYRDLVSAEGLIDHVEALPWKLWKRKRWTPGGFFAPLRAYMGLRALRFDYGLDLQGHSKTALCLRLAAPKKRLSARATDLFARMLNPMMPRGLASAHAVEWNLAALSHASENRFEAPADPIMPALIRERAEVQSTRTGTGSLATIMVGAGHPTKLYPIAQWEAVARMLEAGFEVVFLGGPGDPKPNTRGTRDLVGKTTLRQTMAWVAESDVHIAADTGTGHVAAAYGVPVVSVFGPFEPSEFRPYTSRGIVLREGADPALVSPDRVAEAARRLLEEHR